MWIATMDSEHYSFLVGADTRTEVYDLMGKAFRSHIAYQYGDATDDWLAQCLNDGDEIADLGTKLDEHYGVRVFEVDAGDAFRDGEHLQLIEPEKPKRYLEVRYDVTGLTDEEVGQLALEASAQAEDSDGHPAVSVEIEDPA